MADIDKPGSFYLGRPHDLANAKTATEPLLYDTKDLTTHAVCVGMTGSGKTGLCLALLEEAALDGIPAIAIDPKGDLGNLLLAFPNLRPSDFRPWVDAGEAAGKRCRRTSSRRARPSCGARGLAEWDEGPERIRRFRDAVDRVIYTPGSSAGLPLTVLKSFAAPPTELVADADALRRTDLVGDVGPARAAGHRRRSAPQPRAHSAVEAARYGLAGRQGRRPSPIDPRHQAAAVRRRSASSIWNRSIRRRSARSWR